MMISVATMGWDVWAPSQRLISIDTVEQFYKVLVLP